MVFLGRHVCPGLTRVDGQAFPGEPRAQRFYLLEQEPSRRRRRPLFPACRQSLFQAREFFQHLGLQQRHQ